MVGKLLLCGMDPPGELSVELAGRRVGPVWRPVERVGEGATSVVWRAEHRQSGQTVALKVARPGALEVLSRETALLARVMRRWGPALVDAGEGFVATEWMAGQAIDRGALGTDPDRVAAIVAHAVARALAELHEAGVHHGDVKPA